MTKDDHSTTTSQFAHLTYPELRINDNLLDENPRVIKFQSKFESFQLHEPPTTNIGTLSRLPLELLQEVLYQLDIATLVGFRRVNRQAFVILGSVPAYRAIAKHARNALCGALAIGAGRWISCGTLYEKLSTPECEVCGDFAGYLYLLTCKRVCFICLSEEPLYLPLRLSHACRKFGLNSKIINKLPCMRVIPGTYSPNEKKTPQCILVDCKSALTAGITAHGSIRAMDTFVSDLKTQRFEEYIARKAAARNLGDGLSRVRRPPTHDPHDGQSGNPLRFVAVARVPCLSAASQELEWGFHCLGCERAKRSPLHYRRKFTVASFKDHLAQCGGIRNGEHHLN
ncbi:hypothetical protein GQX73_g10596 [Xylaria multiplex]|uniref:F-box domain-containing protein n=1 Tax=Xylaria multiplex TaxID=323545 RepID=A0A7C8IGD7_9PEZI|nr:hypothetical protein GQX73_g10596 [Xylaria multiplex]